MIVQVFEIYVFFLVELLVKYFGHPNMSHLRKKKYIYHLREKVDKFSQVHRHEIET